jgi:peptide/nickel transport system permease protein
VAISVATSATAPTSAKGGGARARRPRAGVGLWVLRKLVGATLTLGFVLVFNFVLFRMMPGDPAKTFLRGRQANRQRLDQLRDQLGLDDPWPVQFGKYLNATLHGNLGDSWSQGNRPVAELLADRIWPTLLLSGTSLVLAAVIGIWLGARSGWRHGRAFDKGTTSAAIGLYSLPEWWFGLLLLLIFASPAALNVFPGGGLTDPRGGVNPVLDTLWHLVLPCTTLTLVYIAQYSLIMRSSVIDERHADYLTTARAKGLRDDQVLTRHALPNALLPTLTLFFLSLGFVISGAITVETVYSWPGLGLLSYEALRGPDIPLLQGLFLVFSIAVILMNLLADLLYPLFDPRVRLS